MRTTPIMNVSYAYLGATSKNNNQKTYASSPKDNLQSSRDQVSFSGFATIAKKVSSETDAITALRSMGSGAFIKTNNGFVSQNSSDLHKIICGASEYIVKPQEKESGIALNMIVRALDNDKTEKVTMVMDDGLQVLHLPKNADIRDEACINLSGGTINIFKNVKKVVDDMLIPGFRLEKVPFPKAVK